MKARFLAIRGDGRDTSVWGDPTRMLELFGPLQETDKEIIRTVCHDLIMANAGL